MATSVQQLRFPPFRLDITNNLLWREEYQIPLRPKALAVLRVLVEKAGHVVAREELFTLCGAERLSVTMSSKYVSVRFVKP